MSAIGLSAPRLERLHRALSGYVERGELPGLAALVARGDAVHVELLGKRSAERPEPMQSDSIFRIASLTKIVTAVAAMMLVEDCRLRLDDSIDRWLPELANRRVLKSIGAQLDDTVPARRAITLRDLLTYRMGFGSVLAMPGTYPIQAAIADLKIGGDGPPHPAQSLATDEWLRRLGTLPLMAQPGEKWLYHVSGDVLGALVARVAGTTLGDFMRERIFEPLGMHDTGFAVPAHKVARLTGCYRLDRESGRLEVFDDAARSEWATPPAMESGGGGLVSTLDDYFAFSRMLLAKGRAGREHLLSRAGVELMTQDHLAPEQREGAEIFFGGFSSWGLGIAVDIRRAQIFHTPGRFGWTGGLGTSAYVDPAEDMIGLVLTQRLMDSPEPPPVFMDFWTLAYGAIE